MAPVQIVGKLAVYSAAMFTVVGVHAVAFGGAPSLRLAGDGAEWTLHETSEQPLHARGVGRFAPRSDATKPKSDCTIGYLSPALMKEWMSPRPWLPPIPSDTRGLDDIPTAFCFDPSTPPSAETLAWLEARMRAGIARYEAGGRWTTTGAGSTGGRGSPVTIFWSFVPDGVGQPGRNGGADIAPSNLFATLDGQFAMEGGRAAWIGVFEASFARYSQLTGINFVRVRTRDVNGSLNEWDDGSAYGAPGDGVLRGDIRIGMRNIDGPQNILAFNQFPNAGDMTMDSSELWAVPAQGQPANANRFRSMLNTVMHELGHALGLNHVCPNNGTKLMEPFASEDFYGPQQDDIRALQDLYGDKFEPNNSSLTPFVITPAINGAIVRQFGQLPGGLAIPPASTTLLSIGQPGDDDWFAIDMNGAGTLTITAAPVGTTYNAGPQDQQADPNCEAGGQVNALRAANLGINLFGADRATVLGVAVGGALGASEILSNAIVPAGRAYLRIYSTNTPNSAQFYTLRIESSALSTLRATNGFNDRVILNWDRINATREYRIFRGVTPTRSQAVQVGTLVTPGGGGAIPTTFEDLQVTAGANYFYWLQAVPTDVNRSPVDAAGPVSGSTGGGVCSADLGGAGADPTSDGIADNNDFIVFIQLFFDRNPRADLGRTGGIRGSDGLFDNNDFIVWISEFFACSDE
jgi:serralysin